MPHVTQNDIAKKLHVSRITVSKALRDAYDISPEMKARIQKVAEELGYIPHLHARNLHSQKTSTIGVVIPDVANSFFSFAVHGIMDAASKHGYHIILTVSRENPTIETENIMTLLSMRVDGLIVAISKDTIDTKIFEIIKRVNTPLIFFDRAIEGLGFSSVGINDRESAAKLVQTAVDFGYRKIANLAGSLKISIGKERSAGYLDILRKHHLPIKKEWIIEGGFDKKSGYDGFKILYQSEDLPEIIFAANDRIAHGIYIAAKELGVRIPEDIAVIAHGHYEFAELLNPPLTIVNTSPDVLGRMAMDLLATEITEPDTRKSKRILLETEVQINGSMLRR